MNYNRDKLEFELKYFIDDVLNLLGHKISDIRKQAIYCCVEIYVSIGKKFETYLNKLPKAQKNIIDLFIKKRIE